MSQITHFTTKQSCEDPLFSPTIKQLCENPFRDRVESITIAPSDLLGATTKDIKFEVRYGTGHVIYYDLKRSFELFERLLEHMLKSEHNVDIPDDMLIKCFQVEKKTASELILHVQYENDQRKTYTFNTYEDCEGQQSHYEDIISLSDKNTYAALHAKALRYFEGERRYLQSQGGWAKTAPHAL